ncbi:MAG: hypothetical protein KC466_17130 [Myxococcales bacterium]|nr:hypothetical protein [Myxococcales bacterium]
MADRAAIFDFVRTYLDRARRRTRASILQPVQSAITIQLAFVILALIAGGPPWFLIVLLSFTGVTLGLFGAGFIFFMITNPAELRAEHTPPEPRATAAADGHRDGGYV